MKSMKIWMKKVGVFVSCVMLAAMMLPHKVFAIEPLEVGADVTLCVSYQGEDLPMEGVEFDLYKVAEIDRFGEASPIGIFADYPLQWEDMDSAKWKLLAETLASYIERDNTAPTDSNVTDQNGIAYFPADAAEMKTGLYLVVRESCILEHKVYHPEPVLVCLPNRDANEQWVYDVTIETKYTIETEITELEAVKVWKNSDEKKQSEKVEVELLQNGKIYDTVELSKGNNWRYKWTDLDAGFEWKVVEKEVPSGYTVTIERNKTTYIITNTGKTPTSGGGENLPQTGMLWWPVPLLAGGGMVLFMIGWAKHRKNEKN